MALTLKQMKDEIAAGRSVLYKGKLITKVENLPSAAQLAQTEEEKQSAAADLDAQIAQLQKQKAGLTGSEDNSSSDDNRKQTGEPETFDSLMKEKHEVLVKRAGEVAKERGVEFDPKATKAVLAKFILGEETAE